MPYLIQLLTSRYTWISFIIYLSTHKNPSNPSSQIHFFLLIFSHLFSPQKDIYLAVDLFFIHHLHKKMWQHLEKGEIQNPSSSMTSTFCLFFVKESNYSCIIWLVSSHIFFWLDAETWPILIFAKSLSFIYLSFVPIETHCLRSKNGNIYLPSHLSKCISLSVL